MRLAICERGAALILALLVLTLLAAVGLGLALSSILSVTSVGNHHDSVALLNASDSAIELAAAEFAFASIDDVLNGTRPSSLVDGPPGVRVVGSGVSIDLNAMTNQLTCDRAAPCTDAQVLSPAPDRPWGVNNPRWRLFIHQWLPAPSLPTPNNPIYVIVWIGDDGRESDGDPSRDGAGAGLEGRYIVRARAEAFGVRGGRQAVEAELARICVVNPAGEWCAPGSRVQSWRAVSSFAP